MPISYTPSLALLKPAAAVRIQGVEDSEGHHSTTDLGSLGSLESLGVRERLGVVRTPKGITARRFLGVTGDYWGRSLRSLTGVRFLLYVTSLY